MVGEAVGVGFCREAAMLIVDGEAIGKCLATQLLARKGIRDVCTKFQSSCSDPQMFAGRKSVFVLQGEFAEVDIARDPDIVISSGQATTCVVGVAVCKQSNIACICHMDGRSSTLAHLRRWLRGMIKPVVYLVGGYQVNGKSLSKLTH